jgi:hypothetical protein
MPEKEPHGFPEGVNADAKHDFGKDRNIDELSEGVPNPSDIEPSEDILLDTLFGQKGFLVDLRNGSLGKSRVTYKVIPSLIDDEPTNYRISVLHKNGDANMTEINRELSVDDYIKFLYPFEEEEDKSAEEKKSKKTKPEKEKYELNLLIDASMISILRYLKSAIPSSKRELHVRRLINRESINDPSKKSYEDIPTPTSSVKLQFVFDSQSGPIMYPSNSGSGDYITLCRNAFWSKYTLRLGPLLENRFGGLPTIQMDIFKGNKVLYTTINPNETNSIPECKKLLSTLSSVPEKSAVYQAKRSGDWLQALSCLDMKRVYKTGDGNVVSLGDEIVLVTHDRILLWYALSIGIDVLFTQKDARNYQEDVEDPHSKKYLIFFLSMKDRETSEEREARLQKLQEDGVKKIVDDIEKARERAREKSLQDLKKFEETVFQNAKDLEGPLREYNEESIALYESKIREFEEMEQPSNDGLGRFLKDALIIASIRPDLLSFRELNSAIESYKTSKITLDKIQISKQIQYYVTYLKKALEESVESKYAERKRELESDWSNDTLPQLLQAKESRGTRGATGASNDTRCMRVAETLLSNPKLYNKVRDVLNAAEYPDKKSIVLDILLQLLNTQEADAEAGVDTQEVIYTVLNVLKEEKDASVVPYGCGIGRMLRRIGSFFGGLWGQRQGQRQRGGGRKSEDIQIAHVLLLLYLRQLSMETYTLDSEGDFDSKYYFALSNHITKIVKSSTSPSELIQLCNIVFHDLPKGIGITDTSEPEVVSFVARQIALHTLDQQTGEILPLKKKLTKPSTRKRERSVSKTGTPEQMSLVRTSSRKKTKFSQLKQSKSSTRKTRRFSLKSRPSISSKPLSKLNEEEDIVELD